MFIVTGPISIWMFNEMEQFLRSLDTPTLAHIYQYLFRVDASNAHRGTMIRDLAEMTYQEILRAKPSLRGQICEYLSSSPIHSF